MEAANDWISGHAAWTYFIERHPELGYKAGRMNFHNFLRYYRDSLVEADAIRLAKRRFWIAHRQRFCEAAFDCATGQVPAAPPQSG